MSELTSVPMSELTSLAFDHERVNGRPVALAALAAQTIRVPLSPDVWAEIRIFGGIITPKRLETISRLLAAVKDNFDSAAGQAGPPESGDGG